MEAIVKIKTQKGNENISYFLKFLLGVYSAVIVWTVSIGCLQYSHCLNSVYWVSTVVIVWTVSIVYIRHIVPGGFICLVDV